MTQPAPLNLINFGKTVSCTFDLAPIGTLISGVQVLSEALVRRLLTPRGRLLDDPDYGYEIIQHVNDDMSAADAATVGAEIDQEFQKDPRVAASSTVSSFSNGTLTTVSTITAASGGFQLVLFLTPNAVPFLSYQILRAGSPVPPPPQNNTSAPAFQPGLQQTLVVPFDPTQLSNLALWLRADLGVGLTSGVVSSWNDQSGNGLNFTQGTVGQRPAQTAGAGPLGGAQPAIVYTSASNNVLDNASSGVLSAAATWTVFLVLKTGSISTAQLAACFGSTGSSGWGFGVSVAIANSRTMTAFGGGGTRSFGTATTNWEKWTLQNNAAVQTARVGGSPVALSGSNISSVNPNAHSDVGGLGTVPTDPWSGSLWELIVYNRALSASEILQVEAYQFANTGL